MKATLRIIGLLVGLFLLYVVVVLIHGTATDFQPEQEIELEVEGKASVATITDSILTFIIWNIGYTGLGAESDFFYDSGSMLLSGGKNVRPKEPVVEKNIQGVLDFIKRTPVDFLLLQEVDVNSKRSYFTNHYEQIGALLPDYTRTFAVNYNTPRMPLPVLEPWNVYGKVYSGLASYSRFQPLDATRFQLPGDYPWPTRIFQLDRCVALHRYALSNGKELVVANIHNSAYDKGGVLKAQQMEFLKGLFMAEVEKGNYLIAGGDWNQCPPYFKADGFMPGQGGSNLPINIDPAFLPADWTWVYDTTVPTNRNISNPYEAGSTFVTLIDFYLLSPNIQVKQVKGMHLDFQYSDHQPVWMELELR